MRTYSRVLRILFLLVFLAISIYFRFVYDFSLPAGKLKISYILLSIIIMLLLFKVIIELLALWYKLDKKLGSGRMRDNIIVGLSNFFTIFSVVAIILGILAVFGLKPSQVFTSLSIVAAALAIISKEFISEIIIGIVNGFSNKIELDDYVKVGNHKGKIIDIGLQKVTLLSDDDDVIYIPNLKFYNEEIINYTKQDMQHTSIEFNIDPKHLVGYKELEAKLFDSIAEFKDEVDLNGCELKVIKVDKENIELKFEYKLLTHSGEKLQKIRKNLLRNVLDTITESEENTRKLLSGN
jgi:MscS family membrane protein